MLIICLKRRLLKIEVAESLKLHSWDILPYIAVQHWALPFHKVSSLLLIKTTWEQSLEKYLS
jgi:hypothetical protein